MNKNRKSNTDSTLRKLEMVVRVIFLIVLVWAAQGAAPVVAVPSITLKNDSWKEGGSAFFIQGFVPNDIAASRLINPGNSSAQIKSVFFLYGGASTTRSITLYIWGDTAGTNNPGTEIYHATYQVGPSDVALQEIDLSAENIIVPYAFRVGIKFQDAGFPSIARDKDGLTTAHNFIYTLSTWYDSSVFEIPGDWIIRATVVPNNSIFLPIVMR